MAVDRQGSGRTDEQLLGIFDEPSDWILRGKAGRTIGMAACLKDALISASHLGYDVTALVRLSGDPVIVFFAQIKRLIGGIEAAC